METDCVLTADGYRARVFLLWRGRLREIASMVNPVRRLTDKEVFSESRPGARARRINPSTPGRPQSMDDHREHHDEEFERRFARTIVERVGRIAQRHGVSRLLIVAEPKMLGYLRKELPAKAIFVIEELAKDLSQHPNHELHDQLAGDGLIAPRSVRRSLTGRVGRIAAV